MSECPVCKAPEGCPVEGGVTYHRRFPLPLPPGWRPTVEDARRLAERRGRPFEEVWAEIQAVNEALDGEFR